MGVKAKRAIFLAIIICACVISILWDNVFAVRISMLIVVCLTLLYWILRLFVPSFKKRDEVSMYAGELNAVEKIEAIITIVCIIALVVIWTLKVFLLS